MSHIEQAPCKDMGIPVWFIFMFGLDFPKVMLGQWYNEIVGSLRTERFLAQGPLKHWTGPKDPTLLQGS